MDLEQLTTKETADCVILDPATGKPTDIVITLHGVASDKYQAIKSKIIEIKQDDTDKEIEYLTELTKGWKNVELNGKQLSFSKKNAEKVFALKIIRGQVIKFIHDVRNFLPPR